MSGRKLKLESARDDIQTVQVFYGDENLLPKDYWKIIVTFEGHLSNYLDEMDRHI